MPLSIKELMELSELIFSLKKINNTGSLVHYSDEHDGKMRDYDIDLSKTIHFLKELKDKHYASLR